MNDRSLSTKWNIRMCLFVRNLVSLGIAHKRFSTPNAATQNSNAIRISAICATFKKRCRYAGSSKSHASSPMFIFSLEVQYRNYFMTCPLETCRNVLVFCYLCVSLISLSLPSSLLLSSWLFLFVSRRMGGGFA